MSVLDVLVTLLILLVIFAIVAYVINTYIPMEPGLRNLVMLVLGVVLLIWILLALTGHAPVWGGRGLR